MENSHHILTILLPQPCQRAGRRRAVVGAAAVLHIKVNITADGRRLDIASMALGQTYVAEDAVPAEVANGRLTTIVDEKYPLPSAKS